jgi:hypothetical protein
MYKMIVIVPTAAAANAPSQFTPRVRVTCDTTFVVLMRSWAKQ